MPPPVFPLHCHLLLPSYLLAAAAFPLSKLFVSITSDLLIRCNRGLGSAHRSPVAYSTATSRNDSDASTWNCFWRLFWSAVQRQARGGGGVSMKFFRIVNICIASSNEGSKHAVGIALEIHLPGWSFSCTVLLWVGNVKASLFTANLETAWCAY